MDRNNSACQKEIGRLLSLSARRAWIEIHNGGILSVWAWSLSARRAWIEICCLGCPSWLLAPVALRKESVDRNRTPHQRNTRPIPSLSARRAWIEIAVIRRAVLAYFVALRKESVDRNKHAEPSGKAQTLSLSARRAWIEMDWASVITAMTSRSLSARRAWIEIAEKA